MRASRHIGRVGGLAVALGVGAAVLSNAAVAVADTGADANGPAAERPASSARAGQPARAKAVRAARNPARAAAASTSKPATARTPDSAAAAVPPRPAGSVRATRVAVPALTAAAAARTAGAPVNAAAATVEPVASVAAPALRPAAHRILARPAAAGAIASAIAAPQTASDSITPPQHLVKLVFTGFIQLALAFSMTAHNVALPTPATPTPTLVLNGLNLVPASPGSVVSHYGRWSYFPGGLNMVQGDQRFDVVDPSSGETVGGFDALVTKGIGYNYTQLLVTSGDGAAQVPPAGSVISAFNTRRFGWSYSAVPAESGDLISFAIRTPFGEFPAPMKFNAAEGIAGRTVDNRPVNLGNGYSIAPADPAGETLTAVTGLLPLFGTVQGHQVFAVYDSEGGSVGSFDGVFTTTADLAGNYTQAILVTANDGTNVGTAAGQIPPVGSVYNIIYLGGFDEYILYSSLPAPTGDVVSIVQVNPDGVANVTPTFINASKPPAVKTLSSPQGYTFVPASSLIPSGVNGLPPREVEIQGYQQFDVYDAAGARIGRVDADVTTQWDMFGFYSQAILVTDVADGSDGAPPAGSVFNFVQYGKGRLASSQSTVPMPTADVTSFVVRTPLGDIVLPEVSRPANDRTDVTYFSPFRTV